MRTPLSTPLPLQLWTHALLVLGLVCAPCRGQTEDTPPEEAAVESEYSSTEETDLDSYGSYDEEPTVLQNVSWLTGDTTVEAILTFNEVPVRYSVYALERPHRIVVDCFETDDQVQLDASRVPPPVTSAELTSQAIEGEVQFARLIMFTQRAVAYQTNESVSRLRVVMNPLFRGITAKETVYGNTAEEIKAQLPKNAKVKLTRFKGLGESKASDIRAYAMDPKTRKVCRVTWGGKGDRETVLSYMGKDVNYRKKLLKVID